MSETVFDRSVCCVFSKRMCIKLNLYDLIAFINIFVAISGCIILNVAIITSTTPIQNNTLWLVGIIMHGVCLLIDLLLSTYIARYLYGLEQKIDLGYNDLCCCHNYCSFATKSYTLTIVYFISSLILFITIGAYQTSNIALVNSATIGILIYSVSIIIIFYWSLIFKPCLSLRYRSSRNETNGATWTKYFYDEDDLGIDSSINLSLLYGFSFIITNAGFGIYYNEYYIHNILIGFGLFNWSISVGIQLYIMLSQKRHSGYLDNNSVGMQSWLFIIGSSFVAMLACFIYAVAGFQFDDKYMATTNQQRIFYLAQGCFPLLIIVCLIIYIIISIVSCCGKWCATEVPKECKAARQSVSKLKNDDSVNKDDLIKEDTSLLIQSE